jgi:Zn-dependent membrane protease YugP
MPFLFFNINYLIFMLPAIALALFAQWKVSSTYRKFSQVRNAQGLTGADVARVLMRNEGLEYVGVEMIPGDLTDHYDPRGKVMRLLFGAAAGRGGTLGFTIALAGLVLMSAAVVFSLVTLPVELNASSRAREMLMRNGLVTAQEAQGVSSMLNAAALTYVAGAAQAVMQLLYFATLIFGGRRR